MFRPVLLIAVQLLIVVGFWTSPAWGQSEARHIQTVTPLAIQRGKTITVTMTGENLQTATAVHFYRRGLAATGLKPSSDGRKLTANLKVAARCPLGQHPFRVRTRDGWTIMLTLYVSAYPVVSERRQPSTFENCQLVKNNSSVSGYVSKVGEVDYFRVAVKKGQRLSVDVQSVRLARGLFDAQVTIFDSRGRKVGENDDSGLGFQDPMLSLIAASQGEYRVAIRESGYGNEGDYKGPKGHYILHVGSFARPLCVLPAGGKPGQKTQFQFLGDSRGPLKQTFILPSLSHAPLEKTQLAPTFAGLSVPTPHPVRVTRHDNVIEREPNDRPATATRVAKQLANATDLAFNGIVQRRGDLDLFRFGAKKGERFVVQAFCRRLRSRMDPVVSIHLADGTMIESNDDARGRLGTAMYRYNTHHSSSPGEDSYIIWKCTKSDDYLIGVRDHLRKGGDDYHYRIELTRARPTLKLWVKRNPPYWRGTPGQSISVPQGGRYAAMLSYRHYDCEFPMSVSPVTLPTGLQFSASKLDGRSVPTYGRAVPMLFSASDDAPLTGLLTRFQAQPFPAAGQTSVGTTYEQSTFHGLNPPNYCFYGVDVDRLAICVAQPAFVQLDIVRPTRPLLQNGRLELQVKTKLNPSYKGKVFLELLYQPPGLSATKSQRVPAGSHVVPLTVEASANAPPGSWPMTVVARVATQLHGGGISTRIFPIRVTAGFAEVRLRRTTTKPGQTVTLIADVLHRKPLPGKTRVLLLGLPEGATCVPQTLTSGQSQLRFSVKLAKSVSPKLHKTLFCELHMQTRDGTIVQRSGDGGILHVVK